MSEAVSGVRLRFHLVNVFVRGGRLTGNPLCVFEDGSGLDSATMQALARQFNLSETTFVLPSARATARVRIFTPDFEMPFAGHPTLGTAHVVRALQAKPADELTLETQAGLIPVGARGDLWTLTSNVATQRELEAPIAELAAALGLGAADIVAEPAGRRPLWVDAGVEQLIVPLVDAAALDRLAPDHARLARLRNRQGRRFVYVFAETGNGDVRARFVFEADGAFREDPATGSACANLGGWYLATGASVPLIRRVHQGDHLRRPSEMLLSVDQSRTVRVGGVVVALGTGEIKT